MKEKTFEEQAIDLVEAARKFEKNFVRELEDFDADGLMSAATENLEAMLKCVRYNPDHHDEGDSLPEHNAMEGRSARFV